MEVMNYSLASHTITITLDGENTPSIIIGNGSSVDTISVARSTDNVSHTASADGTYTTNFNLIKTGTCAISLQQTTAFNKQLLNLAKRQVSVDGGTLKTARATIRVTDQFGNINATCNGAYITRPADYDAADETQPRTWNFTCGEVLFDND